jgi:hypothetical protein
MSSQSGRAAPSTFAKDATGERTWLLVVSSIAKTRGIAQDLGENVALHPAGRAFTHMSLRMTRPSRLLRRVAGVTNVDDHQS